MGRMKFILLLSAVAAANALVLDRTGTGSGASCITNDGPAAGSACVFPFNFWGVSHFTCTTIDGDSPWCSTQTDVNDNHVYELVPGDTVMPVAPWKTPLHLKILTKQQRQPKLRASAV